MKMNNVAERKMNGRISESTDRNDSKWVLIDDYMFSIGECYLFASDIDTELEEGNIKIPQLCGIFSQFEMETIVLEVATIDFTSFYDDYFVPENYKYVKIMNNNEIRDFAYNMGYNDGLMVDYAEILEVVGDEKN